MAGTRRSSSTVWPCSVHESQAPMTSTGHHIDFNAPAVLRKWPSLKNERRMEGYGAYLVSMAPSMHAFDHSWLNPSRYGTCMRFTRCRSPL